MIDNTSIQRIGNKKVLCRVRGTVRECGMPQTRKREKVKGKKYGFAGPSHNVLRGSLLRCFGSLKTFRNSAASLYLFSDESTQQRNRCAVQASPAAPYLLLCAWNRIRPKTYRFRLIRLNFPFSIFHFQFTTAGSNSSSHFSSGGGSSCRRNSRNISSSSASGV